MFTQITCPNCGTPYQAEVHQIVDAKRTPRLKQQLISGQLNLAICPQCGAGGQLTTLLAFHDPQHDLFMIHIPQEMQMDQMRREEAIGRITRQLADSLPQEERRFYLFQPQIILTMKSFMEKVLETEGITPAMIERQQKQVELLQTLAKADKDVQDFLIKERGREIDETFFAMLQQFIDTAAQFDENKELIPLINLRARLMVETAVGQKLERQQVALHKLNQDAKAAGGLSPDLFIDHLLANQKDDEIVDALIRIGANSGLLRYEFFSILSQKIEAAEAEGSTELAKNMTQLRGKLLAVYEELQSASEMAVHEAMRTLDQILAAPSLQQALMENLMNGTIDDAFMVALMSRLNAAEQNGNDKDAQKLGELYHFIQEIMEQQQEQYPPEVMFLNGLVQAESEAERQALLDENEDLLSPQLLEMIDQVIAQANEAGQGDVLNGRLEAIKSQIAARL
jgi:hypothetical protein